MTCIKRGDNYFLPVEIRENDFLLQMENVEAVEFCLGEMRMTYPDEVLYSDEEGCFLIPVSQKSSFGFGRGRTIPLDIRVKFKDGKICGIPQIMQISVADTLSRTLL